MITRMDDGEVVDQLTLLFKILKSRGQYVSLKMWTDDENDLKFFISNTPPKFNTTPPKIDIKPTSPEPVAKPSPYNIETRAKKRKIIEKNQPVSSPEIVRCDKIQQQDLDVSVLEDDRSLLETEPSVSCSNRFSVLCNLPDTVDLPGTDDDVTEKLPQSVPGSKKSVCNMSNYSEFKEYRYCECEIDLQSCFGCGSTLRKKNLSKNV